MNNAERGGGGKSGSQTPTSDDELVRTVPVFEMPCTRTSPRDAVLGLARGEFELFDP